MSKTTKPEHTGPQSILMPMEPTKQTNTHEPQALTAARHILRGEDPPATVFLPEVMDFPHGWEDIVPSLRHPDKERHREIVLPDLNGFNDLLISDDCPSQVRRFAIEEALREVFVILQRITGRDLDLGNLNLVDALTLACIDEIEALVKEWDNLSAGGRAQ